MTREIQKCRACGNPELVNVLDLGSQALTGIFPKSKDEHVEQMPLVLAKCRIRDSKAHCGLLQLRHSYDVNRLYGENYGYRSGLNRSMVSHLQAKVQKILKRIDYSKTDLVVDIGSNDSTLLQAYPKESLNLVGIDPTGTKFKRYYPEHIRLIPKFFSARAIRGAVGNKKAKVVTSISMFYDLEDPLLFMREIQDILADDGIWVFEQSYMPTMLEMNSYDTICHEHLEYYSLRQVQWMAERVGLKILDVELNDVNGGSFSVTAVKTHSPLQPNHENISALLKKEDELRLEDLRPYEEFKNRVIQHRAELPAYLSRLRQSGKKILGYGASTKGNVLLQYCRLGPAELPCIAEVNEDKIGSFTPGSKIPIVSETQAKEQRPDYFLVLPWHFRASILEKEKAFTRSGGKFLFPLPMIEAAS